VKPWQQAVLALAEAAINGDIEAWRRLIKKLNKPVMK